jgi:hypothetical protein
MGIKMSEAIDFAGNTWAADTYVKGKGVEPLTCVYCNAKVSHNPAHIRDYHDKSVPVSAYFKLKSRQLHEDCRFAVTKTIKLIVNESKELFESVQEGQYRFRLAMIKAALLAPEIVSAFPSDDSVESAGRVGTTYQKSGKKLLGYINSAKRVLALRALCDDDSELEQHLQLAFDGATVFWPQFYFEAKRHIEAYGAVWRNTFQHPIAIQGIVDSKRSVKGRNGQTNVINLLRDRYQDDLNDHENGVAVEVSIWSDNPDWFGRVQVGSEVVVLGFWSARPGMTQSASVGRRYKTFTLHKLSTDLVVGSQLLVVPKN